ncbi:cation:proton antiporter [Streptomonospora algeriensis]|uniref:Cation:proton antiporter n=1 Tax=Streptomonospora algeriensis TaxID=995084 RepID=A0ABW3BBP4_9ACTN
MTDLLVLAGLVLGYGLISGRAQGTSLTPQMVFVAAGVVLGSGGLRVLSGTPTEEAVRILAEATLVLALFTDAARIELPLLRREFRLPLRLLGIGMPVGLMIGAGVAYGLFPAFGLWEAALLAAVLLPTDAALGAAVVGDRRLPVRIRQSINVESGLNDGIALPIVLVMVTLAATAQGDMGAPAAWAGFAARQVGFGLLVGVLVGGLGGWALTRADAAGWVSSTYRRTFVLALGASGYVGAEMATGNGFIAAFVAGLAFGTVARDQCPQVQAFAEREGELLGMVTFTLFGAVIVGPRLAEVDWRVVVYAVLSLAVVRVLAVAVATLGAKLRWETVLFLGWFGPRGLASIIFALLVVEEAGIAVADDIMVVTGVTVMLSVFAHGASAAPLARVFARRAEAFEPVAPERLAVPEHHVRHYTPRR